MARKYFNIFDENGNLVSREKVGADANNVDFNAGNSGMQSTNAEDAIKEAYNHGGGNVTLDDTVTENSQNGVKSSGIHSFVTQQISNAQGQMTGVTTSHGKNLFNPSDVSYGLLMNDGTIWYSGNTSYVYIKIPVIENHTYSWKRPQVVGVNNATMVYYVLGDNGTTVIEHDTEYTLPFTTEGGRRITIPESGAYLALMVKADTSYDHTATLQVEEGWHNTDYEAYAESAVAVNNKPLYIPDPTEYEDKWHIAANVAIMGDSISTGAMALWPDLLREKFVSKSYSYYGVGGAVWKLEAQSTAGSYTHYVYGQILSLIYAIQNGATKPDVVIIHCGTNDLSGVNVSSDENFANTCGLSDNVFDSGSGDLGSPTFTYGDAVTVNGNFNNCTVTLDTTNAPKLNTLIGGIRAACELLWKTYPEIRIVLTTPIWKNGASRLKILRVAEQMKRAALYLGCQVIDLTAESGIPMFNVKTWCNDGLHPTEMGARRICDVVGNWLMSHYHIEPYDCTRRTVTINVSYTDDESTPNMTWLNIKAIAGMRASTAKGSDSWGKQTNGNHEITTFINGNTCTVMLPDGDYAIDYVKVNDGGTIKGASPWKIFTVKGDTTYNLEFAKSSLVVSN